MNTVIIADLQLTHKRACWIWCQTCWKGWKK